MIQNINQLSFIGGRSWSETDQLSKYTNFVCDKDFGIIFVNVTSLSMKRFHFLHCGAMPSQYDNMASVAMLNYDLLFLKVSVFFLHTDSSEILDIGIYNNSGGPGILGINMYGHNNISNVACLYNAPNSIFVFVHTPVPFQKYNTLNISDSVFSLGVTNGPYFGAGLSVTLEQRTYYVSVVLSKLQLQNNQGKETGNLFLAFWDCNSICGGISADRLNVTGGKILFRIYRNRFTSFRPFLQSCPYQYLAFLHIKNILLHSNTEEGIHLVNVTVTTCNSVIDDVRIENLTAYNTGPAISMWYMSLVTLQGINYFSNCSGKSTVIVQKSNVVFRGLTVLTRNRGQRAGGIYARSSELTCDGELRFIENEGYNGGGVALYGGSILSLRCSARIMFIRNHARHYGGGLYVNNAADYLIDVSYPLQQLKCFYSIQCYSDSYPNISFENNAAIVAGSTIYGGLVDLCYTGSIGFQKAFHVLGNVSGLSQISSNPYRVCLCNDTNLDCVVTQCDITAYPGQTFHISAVAVGQMLGTVPSTVHSNFIPENNNSTLGSLEYTQRVEKTCTELHFTIFSINDMELLMIKTVETLDLSREYAYWFATFKIKGELLSDLLINVTLLSCPLGFAFHNGSCNNCHPTLQQHNIPCDINTQTILKRSELWVTPIVLNTTHHEVIVHVHCPFDYCKPKPVQLKLQYPDEQCALHRSNVLCGKCQHNFSNILGSSNCKQCSNLWILSMIPFACAGVAITVFLMLLNLTVSVGSINGLIFYANVVRANQAVFFPNEVTNSFLSWFIAWVNLDLGFEVCFYNGMDAFAKTWLQFVFPIYIWLIVILIIVSSHYYTKAAKLSGRNAVQVLATLFLLSYAKLLQATITIISSTTLEYPDGSIRRVWLYDGNVDYLKGKHIPLFMATLLVLLVLSLPYTALLLFIQCLQQKTKYRALFWIGKFKPLFDAYTGPYQDKHRYWTGLLLLLRAVLFLIFSVNVFGDPAINLLVITLTVFCLFAFLVLFAKGRIYKVRYSNVLECAFLLNLGFLCSGTLYCRLTNGNQAVLTYTSVGIAFAIFTVVVVIHTLTRLRQYQFAKWLATKAKAVASTWKTICQRKKKVNTPNNNPNEPQATATDSRQVPITFIELREPLLEYYDRDR